MTSPTVMTDRLLPAHLTVVRIREVAGEAPRVAVETIASPSVDATIEQLRQSVHGGALAYEYEPDIDLADKPHECGLVRGWRTSLGDVLVYARLSEQEAVGRALGELS